jgi:hypothetical protein
MRAIGAHSKSRIGSLWAVVAVAAGLFGGCAYSGVAATPDGSVIVARNSLFGANRKIYVCKVAGQDLSCVESKASP